MSDKSNSSSLMLIKEWSVGGLLGDSIISWFTFGPLENYVLGSSNKSFSAVS